MDEQQSKRAEQNRGSLLTDKTLWKPVLLIGCNLAALILLASWFLEPTRSLWMQLDDRAFWAMNNSLSWGKPWQWLWAIANNRAFDSIAALSMVALFVHQMLKCKRPELHRLIAIMLLAIITAIIARQFCDAIPVERLSATLVYPDAQLLTELVPQIPTKDSTPDSFPGDHGIVLLIVAGFVVYYLPRTHGILACCFLVIFTLPRLMGGAHWLSDEIAGALAIALFVLSWFFATPLHTIAVNGLRYVIALIDRISGFKREKASV